MLDCALLPQLKEAHEDTPTIPGYVKIYDIFYQFIEDGILKPGDDIPGENILASHFGVSRGTVRMALRQLKEDGYIYKMQGKKTVVTASAGKQKRGLQWCYNPCMENCIETISNVKCKIMYQPCGHYVAKAMGYETDGFLTMVIYLRFFVEEQLISTTFCMCPVSFMEEKQIDFSDKIMIKSLALGDIYQYAKRANAVINIMNQEEPEKEDVPEGRSIMTIEEVLKTEDDKPVAYLKHRMNGERYRFFLERKASL